MRKPVCVVLLAGLAAAWGGCGGSEQPPAKTPPAVETQPAVVEPAPVSREAALSNLTHSVILPGLRDVTEKCARLQTLGRQFETNATEQVWRNFREQWEAVYIAWCRVQWLPNYPYYGLGFYLWPPRPQLLERTIATAPVNDPAAMDQLGAAVTGLFALEYLLYDQEPYYSGTRFKLGPPPKPPLEWLTGAEGPPRRAYARALTEHLHRLAGRTEREWSPPGGNRAADYIAGGQDSLNLLVNRMLENTEAVAAVHLLQAAELHRYKTFTPDNARGYTSGTSHRAALATIEGVIRHYEGVGGPSVADYTRRLNPAVAESLSAKFKAALSVVQRIEGPLEKVVARPEQFNVVTNAADLTRLAELSIKAELASALGVTITFVSTDGD